jgi:hypothetical protein
MKKARITRSIISWGLLFLAMWALSRLKLSVPLYDYVEYWSAGRLNNFGLNPYDPKLLLEMQQSVGWKFDWPLMMWNPPWTLAILMPFSSIAYSQSRMLWFLISVIILVFTIDRTWEHYQISQRKKWLGLIIGLLFTPTLLALMLGQITPFILLGVIGFLLFIEKPQYLWIAGGCAALITIKPQLLYLFWIVLLLWIFEQKKWSVLVGCFTTIIVSILITSFFNPDALSQYIQAFFHHPPENLATPTIGFLLRIIFGYEKFWLQFLPLSFGIIWAIFYWRKKRSSWNWWKEINIVMFVSIITSSYTWNHDEIVLIPAITQATAVLVFSRNRWKPILVFLIFLSINYANLFIHQRLDESWMIWMSPTLLGLYLYACHEQPSSPELIKVSP